MSPRLAVPIVLAVSLAVCGCDNRSEPVAVTAHAELGHILASSFMGAEDGPAALSRVVSARGTPDGTRVLLLDNSPPFLKVFKRDGSLVRAFVAEGGGPTEIEGAASLAASDEAVVLVGRGFLASVRLDGDTVYRHRKPFQVTDIGYRCQGNLTAYGPAGTGQTHFIHSLGRTPDSGVLKSSFLRHRPEFVGFGRSVIGGADGALVAHRTHRGGPVELVFVDCGGEVVERPWAWIVSAFPSQSASPILSETRSGGRIRTVVSASAPTFGGAAEIQGKLLWVENRMTRSEVSGEYEDRTVLYLVDSASAKEIQIAGRYRLQDVAAKYVLLSATDPWPRVSVIEISQIVSSLDSGATFRRR